MPFDLSSAAFSAVFGSFALPVLSKRAAAALTRPGDALPGKSMGRLLLLPPAECSDGVSEVLVVEGDGERDESSLKWNVDAGESVSRR